VETRKQVLLDQLIAYLVEHGAADLSLRPMAKQIGTSARMLVFHFGSKQQLIAEVFVAMQARVRASLAKLRFDAPPRDGRPLLRTFWDWATAPENFGHLRLQYQMQVLAAHNPGLYARYLQPNAAAWVEVIVAALPAGMRDPAFATVIAAVFDGLVLELMTTGDLERTTGAMDYFIARTHKRRPARGRRRSSP
jgi:AcrR family transcriptional regulator